MVVLGGVTRLTRSGLSMTDWKFTGERPPSTEAEWLEEFARYQDSPEFKRVNLGMSLEEFKFIYWMEWGHRMWGRALGFAFAVPFAYFCATRKMTWPLARRLLLIFGAGGAQGLIGWWMVKSGLEEPPEHWDVPRVSPFRLAAHLTSAFAIYAALAWTTLGVALPTPPRLDAAPAVARAMDAVRGRALPLAGLVAVTAVSGAFVAGMDAGRAYNTFPKMGDVWVPTEEYFLKKAPRWRSFFESTAAVQFNHRVLAGTTLTSVLAFWAYSRRKLTSAGAPRRATVLVDALAALTCCQVGLGVATLLNHVPVELGSAHQATALALFTVVVSLLHALRRGPTVARLPALLASMSMALAPAAAVGAAGAGLATTATGGAVPV
ncbi:unnamed protein product [Pedinophyceae sp. YPF-701]|nr:unnamed protein product [Pedinophyceae sp. YPF-701]